MAQNNFSQQLLNAMTFRCIGPVRGGRVIAVAGDPIDPATFYFGAVAGGMWKTTDAGTTWLPIADKVLKTGSVSDICVAPSDPNVIYIGMGESTIRVDVSHGDGVYKSTDAGQSWSHCGLAETRHIGRVRVHPKNPDIVWVAALGHAFGPNKERGVYKSTDGGKSWRQVLFKSKLAGAIDLTLDPRNPDILYASVWQVYRNFWELNSGGPDSGIWKSTDGGESWTEITKNPGLPKADILGKIGLSASPVQAGRVYALVEAKEGKGMYRSDDFGATWTFTSGNPALSNRPWYYLHVHADTQQAATVYVNNLEFLKSTDGGKNWTAIPTPHGDNHGLWIDPNNNRRMIQSNDGGANVSFNGGDSFSTIFNQLTGQFYNMDVDDQFPYRVYGTQQDNSSLRVTSDTISGSIGWSNTEITGTGESGYIAVHPQDPNIVYVGAVGSSPGGQGSLQRCDMRSGQIQLINVWPDDSHGVGVGSMKIRFPWTFPILFSPHDSNVLYTCGNIAFRTTNEGHSWEAISPDLTRADMSKLGPSGGQITLDTSGAEHYATISTFRESSLQKGLLWAGSDDGLVHVSKDGGKNWENVTPKDLPEWTLMRTVEPSPFDAGTCYLAGTRYKLDDPAPYLYKTTDFGKSWKKITSGIAEDDYVRVVRCDPTHAGYLYCGTETGVYVSTDDGKNWQRWQANLPNTPVYDMRVKHGDLIIATHGRGFWIMDDISRIYNAPAKAPKKAHLFAPRTTYRILPDLFSSWMPSEGRVYGMGDGSASTVIGKRTETGTIERQFLDCGEGAPRGAVISYYLPEELAADSNVSLKILDAQGKVVRTFTLKPVGYDKLDDNKKALNPGPWLSGKAGVNKFAWNLHSEGSVKVLGNKTAGEANEGPFVVPGTYQVQLSVGDTTLTESFEVVNDPRVKTTQKVLEEQIKLQQRMLDKISEAHKAVNRLREIREQLDGWKKRATTAGEVVAAADAILGKLAKIEDVLILPGDQKDTYSLGQPTRLNAKLAGLLPIVATADAKPTKQALELFAIYSQGIDEQVKELDKVVKNDVKAFNNLLRTARIPAVV